MSRFRKKCLNAGMIFSSDLQYKSLALPLTLHMEHHSTIRSQWFQLYSTLKCSYFENELTRKTENLTTRGRMHYLDLMKSPLVPRLTTKGGSV